MTGDWRVKPGGLAARQARLGLVVASAIMLFGLIFVGAILSDLPGSETGLRVALIGFLLVWVLGCASIIVTLFRVQGAGRASGPGSLFEIQAVAPDDERGPAQAPDLETRLRKLEALRRDGLLSEQEYQDQRERALRAGW